MDLALAGLLLGLIGLAIVYRRTAQALDISKPTGLEQKLEADLQTSQREKAALEVQIEELKQQCARLRSQLEIQSTQTQQDSQAKAFEQIQSLLTQYPSVRRMTETKPDLPARNLVGMFTALDNLVHFWGYQTIGEPWKQVEFDPQLHEGDAADLAPGELVYVRLVGYRSNHQILVPAKVSRTLPAGATS